MKEIGGYLELDKYRLPLLHKDAIALNCGRNALAYLIETNSIKSIWFPKYMCDSCDSILKDHRVKINYYSIDFNFTPKDLSAKSSDWIYVVNFFGQLTREYILHLKNVYPNIILDNTQAYFFEPIKGLDTIYSCRKYFGVPDGAFLYTNKEWDAEIEVDVSYKRMNYLLGRFELSANMFYNEYVSNNDLFKNEPIKIMSKLTSNLLCGVDYKYVEDRRTKNFCYLHNKFVNINKLKLTVPNGAFMYPLLIKNGANVRTKLQKRKIYIPTLWPEVLAKCDINELEYDFAKNILPLPVDQRYGIDDMEYIYNEVYKCID